MSSSNVARTKILCYFCHETFDEAHLAEHIHHCGAILQSCSNKCGAYFPRRSLSFHENQCLKFNKQSERHSLPRNFRMETCEEAEYRRKVLSLLQLLKTTVKSAECDRNQIKDDAARVKTRLATMETIAKSISCDLSNESNDTRKIQSSFDQRLNTLDYNLNQVEGRTRASFDAVTHRLDAMQSSVIDQRSKQVDLLSDCEVEIRDLKKFVANESILIGDIWDEHKRRMNDLKLELEMRCKTVEKLASEHDVLSEKLGGLMEELRKHTETIGKQEKMIKTLKYQLKDVIMYVEQLLVKDVHSPDSLSVCDSPVFHNYTKGRLLWRIDKYKEKMTGAKENDEQAVLLSPVFFNKEYGYALQMKLYLNGRDRWRDRNIIGCLQVIEGPWDPLLDWPCVLRASVTLRDQDNPANNIRKIVKTKANLKDPEGGTGLERDSVIDMFIPHTVLTRHHGYTRNNIIFLDVQVTEMRESLSTSSLIG